MKVLIVDDEILVRKGLALTVDFKSLGFDEVFEASNGLEALEITKKERPELIFTDIKMPKMDGIQLIDEVKTLFPETVILVLSCMNDIDYIRDALKFNRALDYIMKMTMTTEELTKVIIKAKNYIRQDKQEPVQTGSYRSIVSAKESRDLRNAIDDYNVEEMKGIVDQIFQRAIMDEISKDDFVEWIQLFGLFDNKLKEMETDASQILLGDQQGYEYLSGAVNTEELRSRFLAFINEFHRFIKMNKGIYVGVEVKQVLHMVRKDYSKNFKLGDIAKEIGLNESYLSRLFKKQMGMNFSDYLNQVRLSYAKKMILKQEYPIYEIAAKVGYNSESYFSRIFKQYEGITPKQYMANHKNLQ